MPGVSRPSALGRGLRAVVETFTAGKLPLASSNPKFMIKLPGVEVDQMPPLQSSITSVILRYREEMLASKRLCSVPP